MGEVEVIRRAVDRRVRRHRRDDDAVGKGEIAQAVRREHRLDCATAWGATRAHRKPAFDAFQPSRVTRSEEHTSELQSLMRISYAVFCLKKKKNKNNKQEIINKLQ